MQLTKEQLDVVNTARHWSEILCKLVPFASDTTLHLSVWLVAAAAIETAVVHRCRQRRRQEAPVVVSRTRRRSKQRMQHQTDVSRAVILLLVVLIVCINAHCFWTHTFVPVDVGGVPQVGRRLAAGGERVCIAGVRPNGIGGGGSGGAGSGKQSDEVFRSFVWPLVNLCVTHVGPFAVIAVSTLVGSFYCAITAAAAAAIDAMRQRLRLALGCWDFARYRGRHWRQIAMQLRSVGELR